ncbi:MAG: hypothetical protein JNK86_06650 [Alphaproteobacteria bacterium]|nr:hypothetical protein [Alphaproteobacteria bacterium]
MEKLHLIPLPKAQLLIKFFLYLIGVALPFSAALGQIMNNTQTSIPFIEPPMPNGFEGRPTFCNFVQSPNYQHTIWQCMFKETILKAPFPSALKEWDNHLSIAIDKTGVLGQAVIGDPLHIAGSRLPSAGLIIGINNENERVAIPLSPYTPYQLVSLVKNERVQQELYFAQPNITTKAIKAWHIPNQGWLVNRIQNNLTGIPKTYLTLFNRQGAVISERQLTEIYNQHGITVTNNGQIVSWGSGLGYSIKVLCLNQQLEGSSTVFRPDGVAPTTGVIYNKDHVLLMGIKQDQIQDQHNPTIRMRVVTPSKDCQIEEWGYVALPRHFTGVDGDDKISPTGEVMRMAKANDADFWRRYIANVFVTPQGQVIVFYYQYNDTDIRRADGVIVSSLKDLKASLWAMQFDPVTKKILWDKLVIANNDPAIESLSLFPAAQPPQLSLAFMPNLNQLWVALLNPSIPDNDLEKAKNPSMRPRIYQLDIR